MAANTPSESISDETLRYIINHVILPPQVPQGDDFNPLHELGLLRTVIKSLSAFANVVSDEPAATTIHSITQSMETMMRLHDFTSSKVSIDEARLKQELASLSNHDTYLPLYVQSQNAGIIIRWAENSVWFEMFELSPINSAIMSTKGRLRRTFPGHAVAVQDKTLCGQLAQTVAKTLAKMSYQVARGTMEKATKNGEQHDEDRDSVHPKMVTENLSAFLTSTGKSVEVPGIRKNTRELVQLRNARFPWRRSSMWLLIRVTLQLLVSRHEPSSQREPRTDVYKNFMLFYIGEIQTRARSHGISSDLISCISAKISRRCLKLADNANIDVTAHGWASVQRADVFLQERWSSIQKDNLRVHDFKSLENVAVTAYEDTMLPLQALDRFIDALGHRTTDSCRGQFQKTCPLPAFGSSPLKSFQAHDDGVYASFKLIQLENWVALELNVWLRARPSAENLETCRELKVLMEQYHGTAKPLYKHNPEAMSVMYLTLLELWVAIDRTAVMGFGILSDYAVDMIPISLAQSFLLPLKSQLQRLYAIERYVKDRHQGSRFRSTDIFQSFGGRNSLPVRYFNQSANLQQTRTDILAEANYTRKQKKAELARKQEEYVELMRKYNWSECDFFERIDRYTGMISSEHEEGNCKRCLFKRKAKEICIEIHEWPLPDDDDDAGNVVFELQLPPIFGCWRECTVFLLIEVIGLKHDEQEPPRARHKPQDVPGLSDHATIIEDTPRVVLLSEDKPHTGTHRQLRDILTVRESDICLANGLSLKYFDRKADRFYSLGATTEAQESCQYRLRATSAPLQPFLDRAAATPDGPPPNSVIATQSECPQGLDLEEYKALASLPLGFRIEWQNILVQLASPVVDFSKDDTLRFVLQCSLQAGPPDGKGVLRGSHIILSDGRFAARLLDEISSLIRRIQENWQSANALCVAISLLDRVASLAANDAIQHRCLKILAFARATGDKWVETLRRKARDAVDEKSRNELFAKAVFAALLCADSFNLEQDALSQALSSSDEAAILLKSTIIIREGFNSIKGETVSISALLRLRWENLLARSLPILSRNIIEHSQPCLHEALLSVWSAYPYKGQWQAVGEPYHHWPTQSVGPSVHSNDVLIHISLLTGELLVDGVPMNQLPRQYEANKEYTTLFGQSTSIEVMPSREWGLRFSAKHQFRDHTLYFGMSTSSNIDTETCMLVRAVCKTSIYELIPPHFFEEKFPAHFSEDFIYWYDTQEHHIELCPRSDPWTHSDDNWRLCRGTHNDHWRLVRGKRKALVNIGTQSAETLYQIFKPLEDAPYVHLVLDSETQVIGIDLPRLQLNFSLKLGAMAIDSRQFRGMQIAETQEIGTLIGLQNKMVLKSSRSSSTQKIIIPDGNVSCTQSGGHVLVTLNKSTASKVEAYDVDKLLGRLVDNGSLQSKLFLSYLHALTTFCLPDPLTGATGTEMSLTILSSAAVRSFDQLSEKNIDMLSCLERLTPRRLFYPENLQEMQSVKWSANVGFLAQHPAFRPIVASLSKQAEDSRIFYPNSPVPKLQKQCGDLLQRDRIHTACFRASRFAVQWYTHQYDETYLARDRGNTARSAYLLCDMVFQGTFRLFNRVPWSGQLQPALWRFLGENSSSSIKTSPMTPTSDFQYDSILLLNAKEGLASGFLRHYQTLVSRQTRPSKFAFMIWLSTLSFAEDVDMTVLQLLAAFFLCEEMITATPPDCQSFSVSQGYSLTKDSVRNCINPSKLRTHETPEVRPRMGRYESFRDFRNREVSEYQSRCDKVMNAFVDGLSSQWPCKMPGLPPVRECTSWDDYFSTSKAMEEVRGYWTPIYHNHLLFAFLGEIDRALPRNFVYVQVPGKGTITTSEIPDRARSFIETREYFLGAPPNDHLSIPITPPDIPPTARDILRPSLLPTLLSTLDMKAKSLFEREYMDNLKNSTKALRDQRREADVHVCTGELKELMTAYRRHCKAVVDGIYGTMELAAFRSVLSYRKIHLPDRDLNSPPSLWPRLSPRLFLENLSRHGWGTMSEDWKRMHVRYGLALTQLQRADRLLDAINSHTTLLRELRNPGHQNWDPMEYPESLLFEIESGLMIRHVQEEIAGQMRSPDCDGNAVMQLNMGEGKSTVIVPIVAAALADGSRLVRVVVAKPQSKQMQQMLVSKLGGMLDRRVYNAPFSRSIQLQAGQAEVIRRLYEDCMKSGGVLLVQPEHILSFMLMGVEAALTSKPEMSNDLIAAQRFLDENSRDIIDESDENFSVKFELVYTMGIQQPIQFGPRRWLCIQEILGIIQDLVPDVATSYPSSLEVHARMPGRYSQLRFLRADGQDEILKRLADKVITKGLQGFPIPRQPENIRRAILEYITNPKPSASTIGTVEDESEGGIWRVPNFRESLLLLRGLIARGIIAFCFGRKRWRVDYGLDVKRIRRPATCLAIPFRAKDNASPRSEFSHPDVVIVLTSLSYYYSGLENTNIELSFRHLIKADCAEQKYQLWVATAPELSPSYRHLTGINLEDRTLCEKDIFPKFRYSKGLIDYFLAEIVFAKEMKEFPHKLSASGWDLGKKKAHKTTGFSGTNDSRIVLPLSVHQIDLEKQGHSNALVLDYLLQAKNSVKLMPAQWAPGTTKAELLISIVKEMEMDRPVRVILDVGAQILELDNYGVAKKWLGDTQGQEGVEAVVFFDDNDELTVLDRNGKVEALLVSPYARQLHLCLVFLDQAHTRGTDLKLPEDYRAAVILGANLTKDTLVQACMRMRLLGMGQSVVFIVPDDIRIEILETIPRARSSDNDISVLDILKWAITETWSNAKHSVPLWALQGRRFEEHQRVWAEFQDDGETSLSKERAERFLEEEAKSLEDRYRPCVETKPDHHQPGVQGTDAISLRCQQFRGLKADAATFSEEQERELSPEIEQEREEFRPPPAEPVKHKIHPDVLQFIKTGRIEPRSKGYMPAWQTLEATHAGDALPGGASQFKPGLLATADFARTIQPSGLVSDRFDSYQRHVQWILTGSDETGSAQVKHMMLISPFEANQMLETIQASDRVALHLYAPLLNLEHKALDKLDLYTVPQRLADRKIPQTLVDELNLFAGQLYMASYDEYVRVCDFLGLSWRPTEEGEMTATDGFLLRDGAGRVGGASGFTESPVGFLRILYTRIRRSGDNIDMTHMGRVLNMELLTVKDFGDAQEGEGSDA
ncbi:hypothetical protein ANO14919_079650 [Xylariales sp. No.14919]|nr:hypothetical protein ANO14919_079650 [Xylariales sp. No.14919]